MAKFRLKIYRERIENLSHFSRLFVCLFGWMLNRLVGWLVIWLFSLMVGWLVGWLAGYMVG